MLIGSNGNFLTWTYPGKVFLLVKAGIVGKCLKAQQNRKEMAAIISGGVKRKSEFV